jgi:hypothetical protein
MKSVATARRDVNAQPSLAMGGPRNSCYSSNSVMESTPTPAEMAAGRAGRTILSVSPFFKDRPKSGSPGQMYRGAERQESSNHCSQADYNPAGHSPRLGRHTRGQFAPLRHQAKRSSDSGWGKPTSGRGRSICQSCTRPPRYPRRSHHCPALRIEFSPQLLDRLDTIRSAKSDV